MSDAIATLLEPVRRGNATLDLSKSFGTQLRGHFEDFFRTIVVTQDLHGLITVSVPQNNSVF